MVIPTSDQPIEFKIRVSEEQAREIIDDAEESDEFTFRMDGDKVVDRLEEELNLLQHFKETGRAEP